MSFLIIEMDRKKIGKFFMDKGKQCVTVRLSTLPFSPLHTED